ncbi:pheromone receptor [Colletotrichum tofieldiae]|nr:pheromone receptor [Colletotrichum tofieldiae]
MAYFDPFQQPFSIKMVNNENLELDLAEVNVLTSVDYGSQIGVACMLFLITVIRLVLNITRMTLLAVRFPSNRANIYCLWAADYSCITPEDYYRSAVTEAICVILQILVRNSLGIQARFLVNLLPGLWKWFFTRLSYFIPTPAICLRIWRSVINTQVIISVSPAGSLCLCQGSGLVGTISTCYCDLFNIKLQIHLVINRVSFLRGRG